MASNFDAENMNSDEETQEIKEFRDDEEFDPNDVLNSGKKSKRQQEDDVFGSEVKVDFNKDSKNFQLHELKDMQKSSITEGSNVYGTL